ncbi:MAG: flagellar biosynthesis protein FlhB [Clostridia bacterium]|nr:flagellar biosynthesis protein FlhB [Clostridia bacterium]
MGDSAEKTEEATPKKRRDARKKGQVAVSNDIVNFISMAVAYSSVRILFPTIVENLMSSFQYFSDLAQNLTELNNTTLREMFIHTLWLAGSCIIPLLLLVAGSAIIATVFQTRGLFSMEAVRPKFEKLNPLNGFKRIMSMNSVIETVKNLVKVTVIGVVIYRFIRNHDTMFARMLDMGIEASAAAFFSTVFSMILQIVMFFAVIAGADFAYQRYSYNKNLRMSKQEVKEEYKQEEGDPQIKGRIRQLQRQMAMGRMMQQVPEADVVIRNPTHYAIAIKYEPQRDIAPRILAKGADHMALRIVNVAEQNGIFIQEDKELTRAIYPLVEVGDMIPYEFYNAIADLLALVYRMKTDNII